MTTNRRNTLIPGLLMVLVGVWLLLRNLNVPIAGIDVLWPVFPLAFGLAFLLQYFLAGRQPQDSGLVFVGSAAALTGAFFFLFTLGRLRWADMDRYWPIFVIIGGVAFFAQWLTNPSQRGLLVPGSIALIIGVVALSLGNVNSVLLEQFVKLWPIMLIVGGIAILASYFLRREA